MGRALASACQAGFSASPEKLSGDAQSNARTPPAEWFTHPFPHQADDLRLVGDADPFCFFPELGKELVRHSEANEFPLPFVSLKECLELVEETGDFPFRHFPVPMQAFGSEKMERLTFSHVSSELGEPSRLPSPAACPTLSSF